MAQSLSARRNVRQTFLVSPPQGTAPITFLPLTFFDMIGVMILPGERLFFYQFSNPNPTTFFHSVIVPNLKRSLELTLHHFAPLAGNVTWPLHSPTPFITYVPGTDSVPLTITESDEDFNLLCSNLCPVSKRRHLVPPLMNASRDKSSLLALQVTSFPNYSAFCVGITMHHAAMDGNSATLFMKAWAYLCSSPSPSHLPQNLTPFFDRSAIEDKLDPKGTIIEAYVESWLKMHGGRGLRVWERDTNPNINDDEAVKCTFELTPSHIQRLRQRYYAHLQSEGKVVITDNIKVSTFSVTYAYMLSCLVKTYYNSTASTITKQLPEAEYYSDKVGCILSVDCRHRVDPPIVPTYFGNCIAGQLVVVEKKRLLGSDGFVNAVEGIIGAVSVMEKNGVLNDAENWMMRVQSALGETGGRLFTLASSPRFGLYGIDFGWGRPRKVDVASVDGRMGVFSLCERRDDDGGVEIGLSLNKGPHMETFEALFSQGLLE